MFAEVIQYRQSSERQQFLGLLATVYEQKLFASNISLLDFSRWFESRYPAETVVDGFFFLKKEQLKDPNKNTINFIADTAQAAISPVLFDAEQLTPDFKSQRFESGLQAVVNNCLALVVEHPLAEATKIETFVETWDEEKGQLFRDHKSLDQILDLALLSSQTLGFEQERFLANYHNYHDKLKQGRRAGQHETFVEFSPSPKVTKEALGRGYLGNSCIFFFEYDPETDAEQVTQYWLNASWDEFGELLRDELQIETKEKIDDVAIIQHSDFMSEHNIQAIRQFIRRHHGELSAAKPELFKYVSGELRQFLESELRLFLISGARKLLRGADITHEEKMILSTLAYAQDKLKHKISLVTNLNTNSRHFQFTSQQIQRMDSDPVFRVQMVKEQNMPLSGCGVSSGDLFESPIEQLIKEQQSIFGASGSPYDIQSIIKGENYKDDPNLCRCGNKEPHFHCPGKNGACKEPIVVGEGTTKCSKCGQGKVC